ncbi:MAG: bifunctional DNA primase/polymerase [Nanoarchaeota archaeon]|nr:bifunctional DNA primase/polymerase [Nanoarchaeota archaeon]
MNEKIPKQLQKEEFGFCMVELKKKKPYENQWQNKPYKFGEERLLIHLQNGGNYGVISGYGNLRILDIDDLNLVPIFDELFKDTFSVETPSGGRHYYFICDYEKNHVLRNGAGELRSNKMQCVGPNCEVK